MCSVSPLQKTLACKSFQCFHSCIKPMNAAKTAQGKSSCYQLNYSAKTWETNFLNIFAPFWTWNNIFPSTTTKQEISLYMKDELWKYCRFHWRCVPEKAKNWGWRKGKNSQNRIAVRIVSAVTNFVTSFKKNGEKKYNLNICCTAWGWGREKENEFQR